MNAKKIVKLSNTICIISVLLLCYWVFTFIVMQVFGLKIFRENITQTFYFSILAILALMSGALITNVMFNLTRIAEKHNNDSMSESKEAAKVFPLILILLFPLITVLLFTGDYLTSKKKEKMLIKSAESIIENNRNIINNLVNYEFSKEWIEDTQSKLELLSKTDKNYNHISILVPDAEDGVPVFLQFGSYHRYHTRDENEVKKNEFIFQADTEQRNYLKKVFSENFLNKKFSSFDGHYELFYPIIYNDKTAVLYFKDYQSYGKFGS